MKNAVRQKDAKSTAAPGDKDSFFKWSFLERPVRRRCDRQGTLHRAVSKGHQRRRGRGEGGKQTLSAWR